jgi:hypothetical protein
MTKPPYGVNRGWLGMGIGGEMAVAFSFPRRQSCIFAYGTETL